VTAYCNAAGYGGYGGYGSYGIIPAAIKSTRHVEVVPVHLPQDPITPQVIEVPPLELPVKIVYNSRSSGVYVQQVHQQGTVHQNKLLIPIVIF